MTVYQMLLHLDDNFSPLIIEINVFITTFSDIQPSLRGHDKASLAIMYSVLLRNSAYYYFTYMLSSIQPK